MASVAPAVERGDLVKMIGATGTEPEAIPGMVESTSYLGFGFCLGFRV